MMEPESHLVPEDHPVRELFRTLTERGLEQIQIRDEASITYISGLMVDFLRTEHMHRIRDEDGRPIEYAVDLIAAAEGGDPGTRLDHYKHLGDFSLFMLGLFPERLERSRRSIGPSYYAEQGRRSYSIVADLVWTQSDPVLFRRLADRFELYVRGLNWVKVYIQDPFFQYMFREFGVT